MTIQNGKKLNSLDRNLPEGLLVEASWLERHGYSGSLRNQYVHAGWLEQPARGVFRRPRGELGWEQVVISLQSLMVYPVSLGGLSALELQGYAHYLRQSQQRIHLYSDSKLPLWVSKLPLPQSFIIHNRARLLPSPDVPSSALSLECAPDEETELADGLRINRWGQWKWPLVLSTPERAYLEMLDELPQNESFHNADVMMEGLANLSPRRLQSLLESTKSIKVKRLFFLFAERHNHAWLKRIDHAKIDLGHGKRMLVKGGKLHSKYQITVPKEFVTEGVHGVF